MANLEGAALETNFAWHPLSPAKRCFIASALISHAIHGMVLQANMKLSIEEACEIAEQSILRSTYKGGLKLIGAKYVETPTGLWGTPDGKAHGEWKVFFDKVYKDGFFMEPHIIIVMVDAVTGEVAKFPMI